MSGHHRTKEWFKVARQVRPLLAAMVRNGEAACTKCGRPIVEGMVWQIDHIIAIVDGGTDNWDNLGPAHKRCNQSDGGRKGAAITNARKGNKAKTEYPY